LEWLTEFVEYDYDNFRNSATSFVCSTCGLPIATRTIPVIIRANVNVIKAGLNLKFGPNKW